MLGWVDPADLGQHVDETDGDDTEAEA